MCNSSNAINSSSFVMSILIRRLGSHIDKSKVVGNLRFAHWFSFIYKTTELATSGSRKYTCAQSILGISKMLFELRKNYWGEILNEYGQTLIDICSITFHLSMMFQCFMPIMPWVYDSPNIASSSWFNRYGEI
mgnify:CR=1 FL=1